MKSCVPLYLIYEHACIRRNNKVNSQDFQAIERCFCSGGQGAFLVTVLRVGICIMTLLSFQINNCFLRWTHTMLCGDSFAVSSAFGSNLAQIQIRVYANFYKKYLRVLLAEFWSQEVNRGYKMTTKVGLMTASELFELYFSNFWGFSVRVICD